MPTFNFAIVKKKSAIKRHSSSKIIDKNVIGVVWITKNGTYYIKCNDGKTYNIDKSCYSCKGKQRIYKQNCTEKNRFCYIRHIDECHECDSDRWLPFASGCIVKGNIVINNITNTLYFKIKDVEVDYDNADAHEALKYYRDNMTEIQTAIKNKNRDET